MRASEEVGEVGFDGPVRLAVRVVSVAGGWAVGDQNSWSVALRWLSAIGYWKGSRCMIGSSVFRVSLDAVTVYSAGNMLGMWWTRSQRKGLDCSPASCAGTLRTIPYALGRPVPCMDLPRDSVTPASLSWCLL